MPTTPPHPTPGTGRPPLTASPCHPCRHRPQPPPVLGPALPHHIHSAPDGLHLLPPHGHSLPASSQPSGPAQRSRLAGLRSGQPAAGPGKCAPQNLPEQPGLCRTCSLSTLQGSRGHMARSRRATWVRTGEGDGVRCDGVPADFCCGQCQAAQPCGPASALVPYQPPQMGLLAVALCVPTVGTAPAASHLSHPCFLAGLAGSWAAGCGVYPGGRETCAGPRFGTRCGPTSMPDSQGKRCGGPCPGVATTCFSCG